MKFIHTADTHLGYWAYKKINPTTGINVRTEDFRNNFAKIIDTAIEERVDFVLHAGDLFHHIRPNGTAIKMAMENIKRLLDKKIPLFIIGGNHDLPVTRGIGSPVGIFSYLDNCYAWTAAHTKSLRIANKDITIIGIPYIREDPNNKFKNKLNSITYTPGDINIIMAHQSLNEIERGAETTFTRYVDDQGVDRTQIPATFNYIALGHIHKHQIAQHPMEPNLPLVFPGSIERTSIQERNEKKGFCVVEILDKWPEIDFRELETRDMIEIEYIVTNKTKSIIEQEITQKLESTDLKDKIVTIRVKGRIPPRELARVNFRGIFDDYNDSAISIKEYYDLLEFEEERSEIITNGKQIYAPYEELERYLNKQHLESNYKDRMLSLGREIIESWSDTEE